MFNVLMVDSLREFLVQQSIPDDLAVATFAADAIPAANCEGIIPDVTTHVQLQDLNKLPQLKIIANYGVGYDNIDVAAAKARGILVSNTPGVLTDATAELTWALILAVARRLGEGERLVRSRQWTGWQPTQLRGASLKGRWLGIIGAGRIGKEVGLRARAFGMKVRYWSRRRDRDWELECNALYGELADVVATSDVVTIHLSRSPETGDLIDARQLRDGAILINTSRGAIVRQDSLLAELRSGRISAGLDVYVAEPRVPAELLRLENVVLLPHLGSATYEARQAMWDLAWHNLLCGLRGEPLPNPV